MSNVAIKGGATGTATYTIEAPTGNTDRTLVLPDEAGTVLTSASTLSSSNLSGALPALDGSSLTGISSYADSDALSLFNVSGSAPVYACRAWVNIAGGFSNTFNRIGSGNVSSVTDNGTGDYTLNFATSMPDTNYAVVGATCGNSNNGNPFTFELPPHYNDGVDGQATGSVRVYAVLTGANAKQDVNKCHVAVFR